MKIGILQSRGLGDIVIALPIARYFHDQGHTVSWPICEEFYASFAATAPWVTWIAIATDPQGAFYYDRPLRELEAQHCDDIICLYQHLSSRPELRDQPWFQIQKFDEFKYTKAGVPFKNKWRLQECISRDSSRETALYNQVVRDPTMPYYVTHLEGSTFTADIDLSLIPPAWQRVDITAITDNIWDWLGVIEGAQAVIMLDSVYANIVDQLDIAGPERYWIPRSHIHLTPVLGSNWTILEPPEDSSSAQKIFG